MIRTKTKYVGEVKTRFNKCLEVRRTFEDRGEDWIKFNLGIRE